MCDGIAYVLDVVFTKTTNTIATNVSVNCHIKNKTYKIGCFILRTVLLVMILLLIITNICYHFTNQSLKLEKILPC